MVLEMSKVGSECQKRVVSLQEAGGLCWKEQAEAERTGNLKSVRHITHVLM